MTRLECPECSFINDADAVRCSNCGWPFKARHGSGSHKPKPSRGISSRVLGALYGLVVVAFVMALLKSWSE